MTGGQNGNVRSGAEDSDDHVAKSTASYGAKHLPPAFSQGERHIHSLS